MIRKILRHRRTGDEGAILIIAILVVTVVSLVVGIVLTRGDGSLRATVALRGVAGTSYAADGAAHVAINALRTGYRNDDPDDVNHPDWAFNNLALGPGCFGLDDAGDPLNRLELPDFYPATGRQGAATSAAVDCEAEDATGASGSPVPVSNANKPGHAILTLGTDPSEVGIAIKPQSSTVHEFRVHGGIWSNSNIVASNGPLQSSTSIRARAGCSPLAWMDAPVVDCNSPIVPDPAGVEPAKYAHDAASVVPTWRKAPTTAACDGVVEFEPGYYDDARALNAITDSTVNACKNSTFWFKPGTYYFDFHNNTADPLYDADVMSASGGSEWVVGEGDLVAGTPAGAIASPEYPGSCINPIENVDNEGVQFIFGADSRLKIDDGANAEICGTYHADRPPIAVYGLKTGSATPTVLSEASGDDGEPLTPSGTPTTTPSTFTGATAAALQTVGGTSASWIRDDTGPTSLTGTVGMNLTAPAALPPGSVLKSASLRITHRSTGNVSAVKVGPASGPGLPSFNLPARTTLGTEVVDLTTKTGWGALQKAVHDNGFAGTTIDYTASLGKTQVAELDAVRLELNYFVPQFRAQTNAGLGATNCIATLNSCAVLATPTSYKDSFYIQGTTYTPVSRIDINLNQATAQVMRFGLVARSLSARTTGGYEYEGPVIELPDNSPGWGFGGTIVQLKVYLCPEQTTCPAGDGTLTLTVRVQMWDPSGTPEPPQRQVTVMSWSHRR